MTGNYSIRKAFLPIFPDWICDWRARGKNRTSVPRNAYNPLIIKDLSGDSHIAENGDALGKRRVCTEHAGKDLPSAQWGDDEQ